MRHLVIGQRQKAPNFSAFRWSPHGCLVTIGQHFVTTKVVHLPKRTETSLITESDQSRAITSYTGYARSAQLGPIPCIAAKLVSVGNAIERNDIAWHTLLANDVIYVIIAIKSNTDVYGTSFRLIPPRYKVQQLIIPYLPW